ncbi:MAG TPA: hypothetical protein VNZ62_12955 [Capillimicrobium sp.]|nr:hypothetical protein [Capillimicrobium sp.]
MTDAELLRAFAAGTLPPVGFDHREHVRVAWLLLRRHGRDEAGRRMAADLRAITGAAGVPDKFDATLTEAWCDRIAAAIARRPEVDDFTAFAAAEPDLLRRDQSARLAAAGT